MSMSDPVADLLTRIRNAMMAGHARISAPHSVFKEGLLKVLRAEGYIAGFEVEEDREKRFRKTLHVILKYDIDGNKVINKLERVSKPGRRVFVGADDLKRLRVLDGLGVAVLTTSKGIKSDRECKKENIGGEIICRVY